MSDVVVRAFGATDPGNVRPHNEDALLIGDLATHRTWEGAGLADLRSTRGALLVVSDGLGGHKAGEVASAIAVQALFEGIVADAASPPPDRLRSAIQRASAVVREASRRPERQGMGATLTAVLIEAGTAYVGHIGDSRAYLIRRGGIGQVTHDQSFVQMLVDAGALTPEEAERSPRKNIVMQVMGQEETLKVALGSLPIEDGDRLLLCTDGLSNMVDAATMLRLAQPPAAVDGACRALVEAAKRAGGEDNVTVVLGEMRVR